MHMKGRFHVETPSHLQGIESLPIGHTERICNRNPHNCEHFASRSSATIDNEGGTLLSQLLVNALLLQCPVFLYGCCLRTIVRVVSSSVDGDYRVEDRELCYWLCSFVS